MNFALEKSPQEKLAPPPSFQQIISVSTLTNIKVENIGAIFCRLLPKHQLCKVLGIFYGQSWAHKACSRPQTGNLEKPE